MILIDATYIHSFGGKSVLESILKKIDSNDLPNFFFLLDSRLKSEYLDKISKNNYSFLKASHKNRKEFYKNNITSFTSIICLANVPPPIKVKIKTAVYFHNVLLLNPFSHKISLKNKLINYLKFNYIKYYNSIDYRWVVQTNLVKEIINNHLNVQLDNISVFPVFEEATPEDFVKKQNNNYVYVSSNVPHKNHKRLIQAFINAAEKTSEKLILHLTVNRDNFENFQAPENLTIKYHGTLGMDKVKELYRNSKYAIYPSLGESFGLPLIEAVQNNCKVIASNMPYVNEVITPSLQFNPYDIQNMADTILNSSTEEIPNSKVLIKNKIDNFINYINSDV